MDTQILTQPKLKNNKKFLLGDKISALLTSKRPAYKKALFAFGLIKENVIDAITPSILSFISSGGEIEMYMSLDRKSTTKTMLTKLLELGIKAFAFFPENESLSFQPKLIIFESSKSTEIFLPSGNMTHGGLYENPEIITNISYNESDIKGSTYADFLTSLKPAFDKSQFIEITLDNIDLWHEQGYLASGVRGHNYDDIVRIKSISELKESYSSKNRASINSHISEPDNSILVEIPDDFVLDYTTTKDTTIKDLSSSNFEEQEKIDISKSENVDASLQDISEKADIFEEMYDIPEENKINETEEELTPYFINDDVIDVEDMLFQRSKLEFSNTVYYSDEPISELKVEKKSPPSINDYIQKSTATDLSKTSIFMIHSNKIQKRGIHTGEIKIPSYLRDTFDKFWNWPTNYTLKTGEINQKEYICKFEIIDVLNSMDKIIDENVSLIQKEDENSFVIISEVLKKLDIQEFDILRFIKENGYYTCEIIRQNAPEYKIWNEFCSHNMKGSKRKYGIS